MHPKREIKKVVEPPKGVKSIVRIGVSFLTFIFVTTQIVPAAVTAEPLLTDSTSQPTVTATSPSTSSTTTTSTTTQTSTQFLSSSTTLSSAPPPTSVATVSNPDFFIFSRTETYPSGSTTYNDIYKSDGTLVVSLVHQRGFSVASSIDSIIGLDSPDVSANGTYLIHGFISFCTRSSSSCAHKQQIEVRNAQSGQILRTIPVQKDPLLDKAIDIRFKEGSQKTIKATFQSGDIKLYNAETGEEELSLTSIKAPNNSSFKFLLTTTASGTEVRLQRGTEQAVLIYTAAPSEKVTDLDVSPDGRYALLNVERFVGTSASYTETGDIFAYNIGSRILSLLTRGRVTSDYRFVGGVAFFNVNITSFNGYIIVHTNWGAIFNANNGRYTRTTFTSIFTTKAIKLVSTSEGNKIIFGGESHGPGNNALGIYDVATGNVVLKSTLSYGYGDIKAVSPGGSYAIISSEVNAVYVVPVTGTVLAKTVFLPTVTSGVIPTLTAASFISATEVVFTSVSGAKVTTYYYDIPTNILVPLDARGLVQIIRDFYGAAPALPSGVIITTVTPILSNGVVTGLDVEAKIPPFDNLKGTVDNQLIEIRNGRIHRVLERNASNGVLIKNVFSYSPVGNLTSIARYNKDGTVHFSTIFPYVDWQVVIKKTDNRLEPPLSRSVPLYLVMRAAAAFEIKILT